MYRCIAEFVDVQTGERVRPGSPVHIDDPDRIARLKAAKVIVAEAAPERKSGEPRSGKQLQRRGR